MKTKIFRVQGKFMMGQGLKHFTKELKAVSEDDIREKIYSEFGSKHRIGTKQDIHRGYQRDLRGRSSRSNHQSII